MSSTDIGINFRATSGYVTDGAEETYCLESDAYPTTRAGRTFGWASSLFSRDRDSSVDPRLAGINFGVKQFRLDLSATGLHEIHAALGDDDATGGYAINSDFKDDSSVFASVVDASVGGTSYVDAAGVEYSQANWPANESPISHTFTTTVFQFDMKLATNDNRVAHLRVVQSASAALAGTCSLNFSASANPRGPARISGSPSLSFGASANPRGPARLAAAAQLSFASLAHLKGVMPISGSASLSFAASGLLSEAGIEPTIPGLEFTLPANRMGFTLPISRLHHTLQRNKLHFTLPDEDQK